MLLAQARIVLSDLRADIARRGYDAAEKRHFFTLIGDLKYLYSNTHDGQRFDLEKFKQVAALEKQIQEDRRNPTGGADTIHSILAKLERFVPDLPTEMKSNVTVIPAVQEIEADRILAELKRRGVTVSA